MNSRPRIIVDDNIPFIKGRLEPFADVEYADQFGFTPSLVADADAMIIRTRTRCDRSLLEGSKVLLIATATIGMDQFDLEWCRANGIECRNSPGCNAPGVAQYVWSALLRSGFDPKRMTLGVVGCGNVGSIVADWGRKLGANVLISDPPKAEIGELDTVDSPLDELLRSSDAVTLHTPLIRTGKWPTFHLIGERELSLMRSNAIIVNAARGPVVDNEVLRHAVEAGKVKAIVDTWEGEPDLDRELLRLVDIGTFHIAGYSLEGKQRATRMVLEAVGERFGFNPDLSGLAPAYIEPTEVDSNIILESYNPLDDTAPLKATPDEFDTLRANYDFRREPRFP